MLKLKKSFNPYFRNELPKLVSILDTNLPNINNNTITGTTTTPENDQSVDFSKINSPELYFGYQFARAPLGNPEGFKPDQTLDYSLSKIDSDIKPNVIYLDGIWKNNADNMELQSETGRIALVYSAKSVNMVAGGAGEVSFSEDGSTLQTKYRGADLSEKGKFVMEGDRKGSKQFLDIIFYLVRILLT